MMHARRGRWFASLATGLSVGLLLTACGGEASSTAADQSGDGTAISNDTNAPATTDAPAESPAPTGVIQKSGSFGLVDKAGYTLSVKYSFTAGAPSSDPSNSAPGKTVVTVPGHFSVTITNTTAARNVDLNPLFLTPYGVYPAQSAACAAEPYGQTPTVLPMENGQCLVRLGTSLSWDMSTPLGPDEALSRDTDDSDLAKNPYYTASLTANEAKAPKLIAALEHPTQVVVLGDDGQTGRWQDKSKCSITHNGTGSSAIYGAEHQGICG